MYIDSISGGAEHEAAERALSTVAKKLDKALSVEYTVNELITEATDETILAQMWPGESCLSFLPLSSLYRIARLDAVYVNFLSE